MLVELGTCLNLVERDDNILEEDYVFFSEWDGESTDNGGKDIEKFGGTIELMVLVDQCEEALVYGLSNHLSSWYKLSIELMKDVLEVVSLDRFFRVK